MTQLPWLGDEAEAAARPPRFPDPATAWPAHSPAPGLLAGGGALTPRWLEAAYRRGIFPWYSDGEPILWWSPAPRMVLPVAEFTLPRSLKKTLQRFLATPGTAVRFDADVAGVIRDCAETPRPGQSGTWIVEAMQQAYSRWHAEVGRVHSVECWADGRRLGGLYGVLIGRMFFGESMATQVPDASKWALCALVAWCRASGVAWVDCQQNTAHLARFGAREVSREAFAHHLSAACDTPAERTFSYDPAHWATLGVRAESTPSVPPPTASA